MPELTIGAVALAPVIAAIVEGIKRLGMPSKWAPILNAALSVIAYLVITVYLVNQPDAMQAATVAINTLVLFLSAAGLYTTVKFAATVGKQDVA